MCRELERPMAVFARPRRAIEPDSPTTTKAEGGSRVLQVDDTAPIKSCSLFGNHRRVTVVAVEKHIVVPCDGHYVLVWLSVEPVQGLLEFSKRACLREVAGVDEDIALRNDRLAIVRVRHTDYFDWIVEWSADCERPLMIERFGQCFRGSTPEK